MSTNSMTGHGRGHATGHGLAVTVEIGTVNRKNLDVVIQLPRGLHPLDVRIQQIVRESVSRGRVTLHVTVEWAGAARRRAVRLDHNMADSYLRVLRAAAKDLGVIDDIGLEALIQLPEVLQVAEPTEDMERVWEVLERALHKALSQLNSMRRREGQVLQKDLQARLSALAGHVVEIRQRAQQVGPLYRKKLIQRLDEAGVLSQLDEDRLLREVALVVDRADITEELTRLDSHVKQARQMLKSKETTGRSLDFLSQELLREINTVGSKANDTPILQRVIECKSEVERFREQVQNIE